MNKKQGTNIEVKRNNRNRVFRFIRRSGTVSNPDIAYETKMSLPTVTQITKELIEKGLVAEMGELQSTGGRRAKALSVAADVKQAVGLDITRNHISLVLTDLTGTALKYERVHQPFIHEDAYYRRVNEMLESFLDEAGVKREKLLGIGVSFPGIIDMEKKRVDYSHILGIRNLPLDAISRFFAYPCYFINDANAGAYAEGIQAEGPERFFYLSLSNTVGGGIFNNGELIQGKNFRCGEAGHMTVIPDGEPCYCGKRGCLDAYCSASILSDMTDGKLERFFQELEQGDERIRDAWERYTDYLAIAVNNLHMVLDCDIILGGYVGSYVEPHMQGIREKAARRNTFEGEGGFVKPCRYKVGAAALGASLKVVETFIEQI